VTRSADEGACCIQYYSQYSAQACQRCKDSRLSDCRRVLLYRTTVTVVSISLMGYKDPIYNNLPKRREDRECTDHSIQNLCASVTSWRITDSRVATQTHYTISLCTISQCLRLYMSTSLCKTTKVTLQLVARRLRSLCAMCYS
jgi:hypothetical protein